MSHRPMIPVKRLGEIVREAEKAYKREDWLTIGQLNQELNAINTGMFWQHGKAYLWALTDGKSLPFDDILEEKTTHNLYFQEENQMNNPINEDYQLQALQPGEMGCKADGMIEIPAWIIKDLARLIGCNEDVYRLRPNVHDPQSEIWLFRTIALYADELERRELKPIANRNREYSQNIIIDKP